MFDHYRGTDISFDKANNNTLVHFNFLQLFLHFSTNRKRDEFLLFRMKADLQCYFYCDIFE